MPYRVTTMRPSGAPSKGERDKIYDRSKRNPESRRFYASTAWRKLRLLKLTLNPLCEECQPQKRLVPATTVHHKKPIDEYPELRLDWDNLESSCASCHSRIHACERTM